MIIHSPVISGSLTFAEGATFTMPDNGIYSGSFSGSFQGDGSSLTFGGTNIISSSNQLASDFLDTLGDGVISGSSQIEFNDINNNPFTQGASSVTTTKHIVPSSLNLDLGSPSAPFRDLYLSSASLYIDGQQVISTQNGDLEITTDANQSLRIVEEGVDTITLQTENGDITLTATGTGNIELNAPIQILAGKKIISSDGNTIVFGEDINVEGDITLDGTVDGVDIASFKSAFDTLSGKTLVSGSSQISLSGFSTTDLSEGTNLYYTDARVKTKLDADGVISGSSQVSLSTTDVSEGINLYYTDARVKTKLNTETVVSGSTQILTLVSIDEDTMSSNSDTKLPTQQSVKSYVDTKVANLVDSAPGALDTLNELAAALGDDANFSTTVSNTISGKVSQSLEVISGDGLTGGGNLTTNRTLAVGAGDGISVSADAVAVDGTVLRTTGFGVISGSSQVNADSITNFDSNVKTKLNADGVISGSSQVEFNSINSNPLEGGSGAITASGHLVPSTHEIYDLGSPTLRWRDLYLSGSTIDLGGTTIKRDALTGNLGFFDGGTGNPVSAEVDFDTIINKPTLISGSSQVQIDSVTGFTSFSSSVDSRVDSLELFSSSLGNGFATDAELTAVSQAFDGTINGLDTDDIDEGSNLYYTNTRVKTKLDAEGVISGSSQVSFNSIVDKPTLISGSSQVTLADATGDLTATRISDFDTEVSNNSSVSANTAKVGYTDTLVKTKLNAEGVISSSAQITITESQISDLDHYTDSDFDARLATKNTTDLDEGTNLYYTDTRVKTKLNAEGVISGSSAVSITLSQVTDVTATATEVNVLDGITATTAELNILDGVTATAAELNVLDGITATTTELNYVDGVTSNIQSQLNGKQAAGSYVTTTSAQALPTGNAFDFAANTLIFTRANGEIETVDFSSYLDDTNLARIISGVYNAGSQELVFTRDDASTFSIDASMFLDDTNLVTSVNGRTSAVTTVLSDYGITATSAEINKLDGVTATTAELNILDGVTATTAELNFVDGVTSNIQTQLNSKLASSHDFSITLTGDVTGTGTVTNMGNVSFSTTVVNDSHSHSNYITSNANDTASGIITFSNTTASTSKTTGAVIVTGGVGIGGDLNVGGDVVAYASSDERLKKNIEIISEPIEKVKQLKGVTWNWKDEASEAQKATPALGVIAQDVEKVLPQLVDTRENGYKAVDYGKLTGLLIEAIKEQQKQIDELKSRLG